MLNEITQKLPPINLTLILIILGIGFFYRLWKLLQHKRFAKRFLAKYIETIGDNSNVSLEDTSSYEWLLHNLSRIKEEMAEHGRNSDGVIIGRTITHLHDQPAILPLNLGDAYVSLEKYIGTLGNENRKLWMNVWNPVVLLMHVIDLVVVDIILNNTFNSYSRHPATDKFKKITSIFLTLYMAIAAWDDFVKAIMKFI